MYKYNPDAKCPKCGHIDVSTMWRPFREYVHIQCVSDVKPEECPQEEHFHRFCQRCLFGWIESPLDAEEHK